eukprot:scaffold3.g6509.t1
MGTSQNYLKGGTSRQAAIQAVGQALSQSGCANGPVAYYYLPRASNGVFTWWLMDVKNHTRCVTVPDPYNLFEEFFSQARRQLGHGTTRAAAPVAGAPVGAQSSQRRPSQVSPVTGPGSPGNHVIRAHSLSTAGAPPTQAQIQQVWAAALDATGCLAGPVAKRAMPAVVTALAEGFFFDAFAASQVCSLPL